MTFNSEADYERAYEQKSMVGGGYSEAMVFSHLLTPHKIFLENIEPSQFMDSLGNFINVEPVYEGLGKVKYKDAFDNYLDIHDITPYNDKGECHGVRRIYSDNQNNSNIEREIPYRNGKIHGTLREYSPSGVLVIEQDYYNDIAGNKRVYSEDGTLKELITEEYHAYYSKNGLSKKINNDGSGVEFEYDDGKLCSKIEYQKGAVASRIEYFPTVKISELKKDNILDDIDVLTQKAAEKSQIQNRICYEYGEIAYSKENYPSGNTKNEIFWEAGSRNIIEYFDDIVKQKKSSGSYTAECPTGVHNQYFSSGKLQKVEVFNNLGQRNGPMATYYENGNLQTLERFHLGENHGSMHEFDENGNHKDILFFEHGQKLENDVSNECLSNQNKGHLNRVKDKLKNKKNSEIDTFIVNETKNPLEFLDEKILKILQIELETLREFKNSDVDEGTKLDFEKILEQEMKSTDKYGMGLTAEQIQAVKQQNKDLFSSDNKHNQIFQKFTSNQK